MRKILVYLLLVLFIGVGIGYGFLREVVEDIATQTLDPLSMILFDILSALVFMALAIWLVFHISRNGMPKQLAILMIVAGVLLTSAQLIRYTGMLDLSVLSDMAYPCFFILTGAFLLISGIIAVLRPSRSKE